MRLQVCWGDWRRRRWTSSRGPAEAVEGGHQPPLAVAVVDKPTGRSPGAEWLMYLYAISFPPCDDVETNFLPHFQRRKSESDELQMRTFFAEGDLVVVSFVARGTWGDCRKRRIKDTSSFAISTLFFDICCHYFALLLVLQAEIQGFFNDGSASLHTRSLKYGKLRTGTFVTVPPALVRRCKSHFHRLSIGVDVILGLNGYIWVSKHMEPVETLDPAAIYSNQNEVRIAGRLYPSRFPRLQF
ncbi:MAG: LOW QUALITY PROTEIN: hypothetical protein BJ554DRAFT_4652 [Olpidium bornovanus]|uniref:Ribosomal RNA-processing protein 4 n=1 Tax=Olpidium bornovanus TaxID=278681 RepID=A0A8H8A073_9FUNG|nr:MAG: LOW QUALITY PROTEIN: hypothetical protein BJ554DRAFT_4652 [Olpidium bornovanus]